MGRSAIAVLIGLLTLLGGCKGDSPAMSQPSFEFTVEDVFYIKPPVDRVILVGTIQEGVLKVGDAAVVLTKNGQIPVVVEAIEAFKADEIQQASAGDQVGLRLQGIKKDETSKGDKVIGKRRT
jgi:translation elongation factor EF-Tu-like GTPase